ncbi:hypothetical protein [Pseudoalteromonas aurantia]|uniref:SnoaL-like domain-containing protein n=1 Tax=Pseudoalteromonas aurantia 208 TaxID=1314867 RepID=A0ABR9ED79_9GAMM|nr:hypothetical protein [Pseudoalteromonas aurantia]MBE0368732.1 hypothetical protein [Pseudoalteromonas aurantia 208]
MKEILPIFWLLYMALMSLTTQAKQADVMEIEAVFAAYMDKYNDYLRHGELTNKTQLYHDKMMVLSGRSGAAVTSANKFNEQVKGFLDSLKKQGVTRVSWEKVGIQQLSDSVAIVSNRAVRYLKTGEVHNRVGATYFINKVGGSWKISAFTVHSPNTVLPI